MKMIWHILKKDIRAIWPVALAWLSLIAVRIPLIHFYMHSAGERALALIGVIGGFALLADILCVFSLVRHLVHEDPVVGDKAFWVTRPIEPQHLLLAKIAGVCLVCLISPLVLLVPTWLGFGFREADITRVLGYHCILNASLVLAALAFSVVTNRASRFWVALVAAIVIVVIALITLSQREERFGLHRQSHFFVWVFFLVAVVVFGIVQQFIIRRTWIAWTTLAIGVLPIALTPSSWNFVETKPEGRRLQQPLQITWKDSVIYLGKNTKESSLPDFVRGNLAVSVPAEYSRMVFKLLDGEWVDSKGTVEKAEPRDYSGGFSEAPLSPAFRLQRTTEGGYGCEYPLILSARWLWNKEQPWEKISFSGRLLVEFSRTNKIADVRLASGVEERTGSYSTRLVKVRAFEKGVRMSIIAFSAAGAPTGSASVQDASGVRRQRRESFGSGGFPLLWMQMSYMNELFGEHAAIDKASDSIRDSRENFKIGRETQEDLGEAGWRFVSNVIEKVGYGEYALKADQLKIDNGSGRGITDLPQP